MSGDSNSGSNAGRLEQLLAEYLRSVEVGRPSHRCQRERRQTGKRTQKRAVRNTAIVKIQADDFASDD
jgi:hypothetical protein